MFFLKNSHNRSCSDSMFFDTRKLCNIHMMCTFSLGCTEDQHLYCGDGLCKLPRFPPKKLFPVPPQTFPAQIFFPPKIFFPA